MLYLCLKFACAVLLLNQFSNSLHTHASLRIICIMGVDCLAVDPLLPAEVLCTSALTLIIGTYGPRQELPSHRRPRPKRNEAQSILFCTDIYTDSSLRWPRLFGKHGRSTRVDSRAEQAAQNAGSSPSATPAAAAQGRGHRGPHNPLSALSAPGCAFPTPAAADTAVHIRSIAHGEPVWRHPNANEAHRVVPRCKLLLSFLRSGLRTSLGPMCRTTPPSQGRAFRTHRAPS